MKRYRSCSSRRRSAPDLRRLFLGGLFGLTALLQLSSCSPERTWDVRGRVVGFSDDGRTVFIAHENIPSLMPAMTMPFRTSDTLAVQGILIGDDIRFVLHASRDSSWISDLRPLGPDTPPLVLEEAQPPRDSQPAPLDAGDQLPAVTLLDHHGDELSLERFAGQFLLINFIYTRCPLPDFCPWMTRQFSALEARLDHRFPGQVHLLSVTVDPEYDSPAVMRAYAEKHTISPEDWTFATGDPEEIRRLAFALGLTYAGGGEEIVHSLVTALVDTSGALNAIWRGNDWSVDDVLARLDYLTATSSAATPAS